MTSAPRLRLGITLWLIAMAGVVVLTLTTLPQWLARMPMAPPMPLALTASLVQGGLLAALAVWTGLSLSAPLGLGAPCLQALVLGGDALTPLRRQLMPALVAGVATGLFLSAMTRTAPAALLAAGATVDIPLSAKLLYGGATEEILMRWGLMTFLLWLPWRFLQQREGKPHAGFVAAAVIGAALLFGLLHLPAIAALEVPLTWQVITYIVAGNAAPGIVLGFLYRLRGIEAAMLAHALAHLVAHP
ncbi:MAG: hypothetical protein AMXMBFR59_24240 [Rhodanobacteraceae bacterium]